MNHNKGLTLLGWAMVIACMGVIAFIVITPSLLKPRKPRGKYYCVECMSHLNSFKVALFTYAENYGEYPCFGNRTGPVTATKQARSLGLLFDVYARSTLTFGCPSTNSECAKDITPSTHVSGITSTAQTAYSYDYRHKATDNGKTVIIADEPNASYTGSNHNSADKTRIVVLRLNGTITRVESVYCNPDPNDSIYAMENEPAALNGYASSYTYLAE